jgi:hypothetical protein
MEQQIQELSAKIDELSLMIEENQRMTKSMYRRAQVSMYFVAIKWIVIIGLTLGSLYYVQPYLETMLKVYSTLGGDSAQPAQKVDAAGIFDLLKNF